MSAGSSEVANRVALGQGLQAVAMEGRVRLQPSEGPADAGGWAAYAPVRVMPTGREPSFLTGHEGLSTEPLECPHDI